MGKILTLGAGCLLFVACGGQSLADGDDAGAAGEGGASGSGGTLGKGGSNGKGTGGTTSAGGSATAGSVAVGGGSGSAGTSSAGRSSAGTSSAGTSSAGTGSAGTGPLERCEQPLVSGNCNAYFQSYGFNPSSGHCESFIYGGCGGNDNRFESLSGCEAACGGSSEGGCPELMVAEGSMCQADQVCHYNFDNCGCTPRGYLCLNIDPSCLPAPLPPDSGDGARGDPPCEPPDCPSRILVVTYQECRCYANGWQCTVVYANG